MRKDASETFTVTAALIPSRGRVFIAQRPPHKKFGLLWEFPGGKVESGETLEAALMREINEELCWKIEVGELFQHVRLRLREISLDLYAFWCRVQGGSLCLKEHVAFYWAHPHELGHFEFTWADQSLVDSLGKLPKIPDEVVILRNHSPSPLI